MLFKQANQIENGFRLRFYPGYSLLSEPLADSFSAES